MKSFISLEEAIDILDANVKAIGTEEVELIKVDKQNIFVYDVLS